MCERINLDERHAMGLFKSFMIDCHEFTRQLRPLLFNDESWFVRPSLRLLSQGKAIRVNQIRVKQMRVKLIRVYHQGKTF